MRKDVLHMAYGGPNRVPQLLPIRQPRPFAVSTAFGCHGPLPWSGLHPVQAREPDAIASDADGNVTR
jgi:hypothetical protein